MWNKEFKKLSKEDQDYLRRLHAEYEECDDIADGQDGVFWGLMMERGIDASELAYMSQFMAPVKK